MKTAFFGLSKFAFDCSNLDDFQLWVTASTVSAIKKVPKLIMFLTFRSTNRVFRNVLSINHKSLAPNPKPLKEVISLTMKYISPSVAEIVNP